MAQSVFINEIHYDNDGTDTGEAIEIAAPAGTDLTGYSIVLYNGNGGSVYRTTELSGIISDENSGYGFSLVNYPSNGIQNGGSDPDGIALVDNNGTVLQFLSYEGAFTAVGGAADGMTSVDIGVSQSGSETGTSLQLSGTGSTYSDFTWQSEQASTFGTINAGQNFGEPVETTSIAEVRTLAEGVEVTITGTLTVSDQLGGPAFIQDNTGGIAIFDTSIHGDGNYTTGDRLLLTATTGAFNDQIQLGNVTNVQVLGQAGVTSTEIQVSEFEDYRGQLVTINSVEFAAAGGTFSSGTNYVISDASGSGDLRIDNDVISVIGQNIPENCTSITGVIGHFRGTNQLLVRNIEDFGCDLNAGPEPEPVNSTVFINEIHYDNSGGDTGEAIEIAAPVGTNLSEYSIVLYNGSGNSPYNTIELDGYITNLQNGYGVSVITFPANGIQNGSPDGIALVKGEEVIQFISYEGTMTAEAGPAAGVTSTDIGVSEDGGTPVGFSLQLMGSGTAYSDFEWEPVAIAETFGAVNTNQTFTGDPIVFINEIHYDNASADVNEGIELAGIAGLDLNGFQLALYNGNGGAEYGTENLSGVIPDQDSGYGTLFFPISGIQNGGSDPDGIALVSPEGKVIQFLSYEGSFVATDGPAEGLTSTDIDIFESGSTEIGLSLQLAGQGFVYSDFTWEGPVTSTYNEVNLNQSFGEIIVPVEIISIAEARAVSPGEEVTIVGTLTVADELGNVAYIQDETGGMAIFDSQITENGTFEIGDRLQLTGEIGVFRELVQLVDISSITELESEGLVEPTLITLDELEDYRGQLVRIADVNFAENTILYSGRNYEVSDASGSGEVRIDNNVESLFFQQISGTCSEIIGVVGRFETTNQLLPRLEEDVPCAETYVPNDPYSSVSKEETLDMLTWNLEWFGNEGNAPASDEVQKEAVKNIILELDADLVEVQEVVDVYLFAEMVNELEGYDFVLSDASSQPNCESTYDDAQRIGFIYKTEYITLQHTRVLLEDLHPNTNGCDKSLIEGYPTGDSQSLWASGRLPFMLEASVSINGVTQDMDFVVIHGKAGSSGEDYYRRLYDNGLLKEVLDTNYPDSNIVLLGDYNDDVDQTIADVPTDASSYIEFVNDEEYWTVTSSLSEAGFRSTIFFSDVIDHITISDELFDNYLEGSATVHYEFYTPDYTETTTDHFPVSARFILMEEETVAKNNDKMVEMCKNGKPLYVAENAVESQLKNGAILGSCENAVRIMASPNPVETETTVMISNFKTGQAFYTVYGLSGSVVNSGKVKVNVKDGSAAFDLDMSAYLPGLYIIEVINGFGQIATIKIIKN